MQCDANEICEQYQTVRFTST